MASRRRKQHPSAKWFTQQQRNKFNDANSFYRACVTSKIDDVRKSSCSSKVLADNIKQANTKMPTRGNPRRKKTSPVVRNGSVVNIPWWDMRKHELCTVLERTGCTTNPTIDLKRERRHCLSGGHGGDFIGDRDLEKRGSSARSPTRRKQPRGRQQLRRQPAPPNVVGGLENVQWNSAENVWTATYTFPRGEVLQFSFADNYPDWFHNLNDHGDFLILLRDGTFKLLAPPTPNSEDKCYASYDDGNGSWYCDDHGGAAIYHYRGMPPQIPNTFIGDNRVTQRRQRQSRQPSRQPSRQQSSSKSNRQQKHSSKGTPPFPNFQGFPDSFFNNSAQLGFQNALDFPNVLDFH